jgi:carotenoid cleavage dioxygenase-like enzyme
VSLNFICQIRGFGIVHQIFGRVNREFQIRTSKIRQINGFYGLIGPDVNLSKVKTLYDLFTGDGIIHGVFLENGEITQMSHKIQTEKIKHETRYGKFVNHILMQPIYMFLNKIGMLPNIMGLANTSFMKVFDRFFILFERDLPYEIVVDFSNRLVKTLKKVHIKGVDNFSAHSKVNTTSQKIHSLEYNVIFNRIACLILNTEMEVIDKVVVKPKYIPVIHDLWFLDKSNSTLFTDSPLEFSFKLLLQMKIPVMFNNKKPTYIRVINHGDNSQTIYCSKIAFYIFHYADIIENETHIQIYAPMYFELGFDNLKIDGKYRTIELDKKTREIKIHKNPELENYNLDFPVKWEDRIILRNIKHNRINGFVICKGLTIVRSIFLDKRYVYGEHSIYQENGISRIMCFGYDDMNSGYFFLINPENGEVFEFPLKKHLNIGFHSIFVPKK